MSEATETKALVPATIPEERPKAVTLFGSDTPTAVVAQAAAVADALRDVLRKQNLTVDIRGRSHVLVDGWALCGTLVGVFPVPVWTRPLTRTTDGKDEFLGWEARVEARTKAGEIVGAAEAECRFSESRWADADSYAVRSMAQTRATSKAMRLPLGFIISLAGYEGTPAEEMPQDAPRGKPPADDRDAMNEAFDEADIRSLCDRVRSATTLEAVDAVEAEASRIPSPEGRKRVHVAAGLARAEFKRAEAAAAPKKPKKPAGTPEMRDALLKSLDAAREMGDVKACFEKIKAHSWSKVDGERLMDRVSVRKMEFANAAK